MEERKLVRIGISNKGINLEWKSRIERSEVKEQRNVGHYKTLAQEFYMLSLFHSL